MVARDSLVTSVEQLVVDWLGFEIDHDVDFFRALPSLAAVALATHLEDELDCNLLELTPLSVHSICSLLRTRMAGA